MAYNILKPVQLISAGDMSGSITSIACEIQLQDNIGVQLNWSGVPVGTFSIQVSNDHREDSKGNILNPGTWVSLPLSPSITATGSPDSAYVDLNQLSAMYMRVVFTRTSGSGTLNAFVSGKGV